MRFYSWYSTNLAEAQERRRRSRLSGTIHRATQETRTTEGDWGVVLDVTPISSDYEDDSEWEVL